MEAGAREVVSSLLMAVGLVVLIIFLFLQNWRSTVIPSIAIPIALLGTFLFVRLLNFNINTLTLFGLTLASGLVVDDAIVIVEDITRRVQEGQRPIQAAFASMNELLGAVIATSLVLIAVFVPVAFFPGTTGQLYKQFALTIAFSITVSTFNAITFTPMLSALLIRNTPPVNNRFFNAINFAIETVRGIYQSSLILVSRAKGLVLLIFAMCFGLTYYLYTLTPTSFLPDEDQGYFITFVQAPEGVSLSYTERVLEKA